MKLSIHVDTTLSFIISKMELSATFRELKEQKESQLWHFLSLKNGLQLPKSMKNLQYAQFITHKP